MNTTNKNTENKPTSKKKTLKLKICGMKFPENIIEIASLKPDYMGFIFYEKSSRFFGEQLPKLPKSIKKVGVFVNASVENIIEKINTYQLQAIQLHGEESPEFLKKLLVAISNSCSNAVAIIKMFSIGNDFDFSVLKPYEDCCDYYLFDTKGKLPGGNGYVFNWSVLNNYASTKPYFLSGGIGLAETDLLKAFQKTKAATYCHAIDVNSKFEMDAGLKDSEKLELFKKKLIYLIH